MEPRNDTHMRITMWLNCNVNWVSPKKGKKQSQRIPIGVTNAFYSEIIEKRTKDIISMIVCVCHSRSHLGCKKDAQRQAVLQRQTHFATFDVYITFLLKLTNMKINILCLLFNFTTPVYTMSFYFLINTLAVYCIQ